MTKKPIDGQVSFFDAIDTDTKTKTKTNYNKIKSMPIDQLANFIYLNFITKDVCKKWMKNKYCTNCKIFVDKDQYVGTYAHRCIKYGCPYMLTDLSGAELVELWLKEKCDEI